jgi:hypothetical protein
MPAIDGNGPDEAMGDLLSPDLAISRHPDCRFTPNDPSAGLDPAVDVL